MDEREKNEENKRIRRNDRHMKRGGGKRERKQRDRRRKPMTEIAGKKEDEF